MAARGASAAAGDAGDRTSHQRGIGCLCGDVGGRRGLRINIARKELVGRGVFLRRFKMQKHVLALTTSAFVLACGAIAASAQQGPMMQQQPQTLQQQEHHDWRGGTMGGPGMMGRGGMMGPGSMHSGMMMRM